MRTRAREFVWGYSTTVPPQLSTGMTARSDKVGAMVRTRRYQRLDSLRGESHDPFSSFARVWYFEEPRAE